MIIPTFQMRKLKHTEAEHGQDLRSCSTLNCLISIRACSRCSSGKDEEKFNVGYILKVEPTGFVLDGLDVGMRKKTQIVPKNVDCATG